MDDDRDGHDERVIPYEEVVRRRRAIEDAQRRAEANHEVKVSDALDHLLEGVESSGEEGASPELLRRIVEREFSDDAPAGGRSGPRMEERPRPRLVEQPKDEPMGRLCSFETRTCEDPAEMPEDPAGR